MAAEHVAARKRKDHPDEVPVAETASLSLLSIKLPADVVKTAKIVASLNDASMADLIADILRPILNKMEEEGFARRRKDRGAGS